MTWKWLARDDKADPTEWTGFLDKSVRFEGTLEVTGTFRIDGHVKGNIISDQTLVLGATAHVEGQIEGNHVVVTGRLDGVIFAKGRVEIQAKGIVSGEIHAPCLIVEPGGIVDGRCHMLGATEATKPVTIPIRALNQA